MDLSTGLPHSGHGAIRHPGVRTAISRCAHCRGKPGYPQSWCPPPYRLVQIPDESLSLIDKHDLAFDVLSDIGSETAEQYGIAFDVSEDLAALYDQRGLDLQRVNGGHARTLPLPATYVIDSDGIVRWAFVATDHTLRAEPADLLTALDALS
jgi:AhpC/TSA family